MSGFGSCCIDLSLEVDELVYDGAIALRCGDRPPPGLLHKYLAVYGTRLPPFSGLLLESLAMGAFLEEHCRSPHLHTRVGGLLHHLLLFILQLLECVLLCFLE